LLWFLAAIVVAAATSAATISLMRTDFFMPGAAATRTMGPHLAEIWNDEAACENYVAEMRAETGIDYRLVRHLEKLPRFVHANAMFSDDMKGNFFISVEKDDVLLGAVEFHQQPRNRWWRLAISILAMGIVLAFAAVLVAGDLARPLERVASAAERLGLGHLRTRVRKPGEKGSSTYEINQVAEAFDTMADKVEQMVQGQRELLGAISHELRSPLGRARVALEIARERVDADAKGAARSIAEIDGQLTEVDAILGDLLAVTRAGLTDLQSDTVTLVPWLRGRVAAEAKGGDVELDAEDEKISGKTAKVDAPLLGRALHNLIANARAHGHPADEPLEVSISYADQKAIVAVRDRGPGFSDDILPRAFEPFVRADVARSPSSGSGQPPSTGLGLALVKRIIEAHGGTVFARNRDGGGAEVGFHLPVGNAELA
jgi:signal transduction histidine kinase